MKNLQNTQENKEKWIEKVRELLTLGGKSDSTFINYKSHIVRFLNNYPQETDFYSIDEDKILEYIKKAYLDKNLSSQTVNVAICAIKYLYSTCFRIELNPKLLPLTKRERLLPTILPKEDFIKIFNDVKCLKYKCWLLLGFTCGLREMEVITIKIENIYARDHKIKVLGKRKKERFTILPDITIKYLRLYCKYNNITDKTGYLFKSSDGKNHCSRNCPGDFFKNLRRKYNMPETITFHSLRHSFATYYLLNGGNLITLQSLLGHSNLNTTRLYIHFSQDYNHLDGIRYVD